MPFYNLLKMIKLENLPSVKTIKRKKRIGRGYGSGKGGHTVGRGSKGQKARSKIKLTFGGTKIKKSFLRKVPLWRGKGKMQSRPRLVISCAWLEKNTQPGDLVDFKFLRKKGLLSKSAKRYQVKILARGSLGKPLKVALPASKKAAQLIEKAGGQVVKV